MHYTSSTEVHFPRRSSAGRQVEARAEAAAANATYLALPVFLKQVLPDCTEMKHNVQVLLRAGRGRCPGAARMHFASCVPRA